jgi:hypothetical protein
MADPKRENEHKEYPELKPDGWERFERAVDAAVKSGPKHKFKAKAKPSQGAPNGAGKSKSVSK